MAKLNKKGIFFTIISILIVMVLITSAAHPGRLTLMQKAGGSQARIELANNYVKSLKDEYLRNAVHSAGYTALNVLSDEVAANGYFSSHAELAAAFKELIVEGKLNSVAVPAMAGNTLLDRFTEIETKSTEVHDIDTVFDQDVNNIFLMISHSNFSGEFAVEVNLNFTMSVTMGDVDAGWQDSNENITLFFSIHGIKDPVYLRNGYIHEVNATTTSSWDLEEVFVHYTSMTYKVETDAPDFLMRYYFDSSGSSDYGIESLVNPDLVGVGDVSKTYTDWCFYSTNKCAKDPPHDTATLFKVNDARFTPSFKLDTAHIFAYNIEGDTLPIP